MNIQTLICRNEIKPRYQNVLLERNGKYYRYGVSCYMCLDEINPEEDELYKLLRFEWDKKEYLKSYQAVCPLTRKKVTVHPCCKNKINVFRYYYSGGYSILFEQSVYYESYNNERSL